MSVSRSLQQSLHFLAGFDEWVFGIELVVIVVMVTVVMVMVTREGTRFAVGPMVEFFFVVLQLHDRRE